MKKTNITLSIALATIFSSSVAFAEAEVTGKIVHESAAFTTSGIGIGAATTSIQTANSHEKDLMKTETSARIYIDGDVEELQEGATYHVELNLMKDYKGVGDYDGNESYTQRDALREAYVDGMVDDWSIRAGKQQVVWGTADGMKLLDTINPTDFSEMAQNQMEDSRMPVWMINAETDSPYGDGGSVQIILSEAKGNKIAGMGTSSAAGTAHTNGDAGNAFIMKGADTLTGKVHGFMNMAPALGKVATFFASGGQGLANITATNIYGNTGMQQLVGSYSDDTVAEFVGDYTKNNAAGAAATAAGGSYTDFRTLCANGVSATLCEAYDLDIIAENSTPYANGQNGSVTNLIDANASGDAGWDATNANSLFEYMDQATFGTFAAFVDLESKYVVNEASGVNAGLKYKGATEGGLNYSFNYLNHDDAMPYVDLSFQNTAGTALYMGRNADNNTVTLYNDAAKTDAHYVNDDGAAVMVLTEKHARIKSYGASFDTAMETATLGPVVLRGEFLLDKGVMSPIVDLAELRVGNAAAALTSQSGDRFSYVLGADITAMTNMMISAQFIQVVNLDFVDTHTTIDKLENDGQGIGYFTNARYTADSAVMHMTNGLQKAEAQKEFVSLFFSKPFGASGEHRWNNIFMFEENGGKWNRLDAEFSIDDDTQATVEFNKYWGNENTQFGQLAASSNIQVGVKYSF